MLYPLRFRPIYQERIWGGRGLRDEFRRELPGDKVGESWEITCRAEAESRVVPPVWSMRWGKGLWWWSCSRIPT